MIVIYGTFPKLNPPRCLTTFVTLELQRDSGPQWQLQLNIFDARLRAVPRCSL